jgi:hypothetical protein
MLTAYLAPAGRRIRALRDSSAGFLFDGFVGGGLRHHYRTPISASGIGEAGSVGGNVAPEIAVGVPQGDRCTDRVAQSPS